MFQFTTRILEQYSRSHVAHFVLHVFDAADLAHRGGARELGRHSVLDVLRNQQLCVRAQLFIKFGFDHRASGQVAGAGFNV